MHAREHCAADCQAAKVAVCGWLDIARGESGYGVQEQSCGAREVAGGQREQRLVHLQFMGDESVTMTFLGEALCLYSTQSSVKPNTVVTAPVVQDLVSGGTVHERQSDTTATVDPVWQRLEGYGFWPCYELRLP